MVITFIISRSREWLVQQRIESGDNVPEKIEVEVDPRDLSQRARGVVLACFSGSYPQHIVRLFYGPARRWAAATWYGSYEFVIDGPVVTPAQISDEIERLDDLLTAAREEHERKQAEDKAARLALAQRWAALPLSQRASAKGVCICRPFDSGEDYNGPPSAGGVTQYRMADLQEFVPAAWNEAYEESSRLAQAAAAAKAIEDRGVLSRFLASIPEDAKRGTLKAMCNNEEAEAIARLRADVQRASAPGVVIFADDEDDDNDNDE